MIISCTPVTTCCVVWREQWLAMPIILMLQFIYLSKVPQPSYLYYGNPFTDKMPFWYWIVPLDVTWLCELPQMIWIFSCDQAALRMAISVCPSVRLWHLFDNVPIIISSWNFQELLPMTKVMQVHAKGQGQKSKVKVTEVMTPFSRFRTVTLVWIHIWWWNDA